MDQKQIIKYVLIAGAVYLVYRYLQQSGALGQAAPYQVPATSQPQVESLTGKVIAQPAHDEQPGPLVNLTVAPAVSDLRSRWSAMSAEDESGSVSPAGERMHNFYHFHFMYQQLTGSTLPEAATLGIDANQDMTFDQFWDVLVSRRAIGLSSAMPTLGMLTRLASAWTM